MPYLFSSNWLRKTACSLLLLCACHHMWAQEADVYTREWGMAVGSSSLLCDVNEKLFGQAGLSLGTTLRFVQNPRSAYALHLSYGQTGGNSQSIRNFYTLNPTQNLSHSAVLHYRTHLFALAGLYELHFLPYGFHAGYENHSRITPFLQLGLGLLYSTAGKSLALSVPLGIGVKYKISPRLNLSLDWRLHFTASDKLDGFEAPTSIKSELMRNKDHYGQTFISLTYSFTPLCPTCNKAD